MQNLTNFSANLRHQALRLPILEALELFVSFQLQQGSEGLSRDSEGASDSSVIPIAHSDQKSQTPRKSFPNQPPNPPSSSRSRSTTPSTSTMPTTTMTTAKSYSSTFLSNILPSLKEPVPLNFLLPQNQKNDGNQFFLLLNGPFYFTFKEPSVSNPLPIFVPLPALTQIHPDAPLMSVPDEPADLDKLKVLPEASVLSVEKSVEHTKSSQKENATSEIVLKPTPLLQNTSLTSNFSELSANESKGFGNEARPQKSTELPIQSVLKSAKVEHPELKLDLTWVDFLKNVSLGSNFSDEATNSSLLNSTEPISNSSTALLKEEEASTEQTNRFEQHLADFLR